MKNIMYIIHMLIQLGWTKKLYEVFFVFSYSIILPNTLSHGLRAMFGNSEGRQVEEKSRGGLSCNLLSGFWKIKLPKLKIMVNPSILSQGKTIWKIILCDSKRIDLKLRQVEDLRWSDYSQGSKLRGHWGDKLADKKKNRKVDTLAFPVRGMV